MDETTRTMNQAVAAIRNREGKYLTFSLDTEYILGMAKTGGVVKILLDIDKVLSSDEVSLLQEAD
jgi:chemotaxis signal transduction protein